MAYQHLYGSSSSGSMGAGYCTLASTPEFYNYLSDSELSRYSSYPFTSNGEHPIKFYHYYDEYRGVFIQSSISYEQDYAGRDSYIANSMVLSEEETSAIIAGKILPFQRKAFLNGLSENFERPSSETIPAISYPMEQFGADKDLIKNSILSIFKNVEEVNKFMYAVISGIMQNFPIFISLPYNTVEASVKALEFMNVLISSLPGEYKKKIGFVTYGDDTTVYKDFNIYFVNMPDLRNQYIPDGYVFDFASPDRYISGIDEEQYMQNKKLAQGFTQMLFNSDQYDSLNYFNSILPKLDDYKRYLIDTLKEIYFMSQTLEAGAETIKSSEEFAVLLNSYYTYFPLVDNKQTFHQKITTCWQNEISKLKNDTNYNLSIDVFRANEAHYMQNDEKGRTAILMRWTDIINTKFRQGNKALVNEIFDPTANDSELRNALLNAFFADAVLFFMTKQQESFNDYFYITTYYIRTQLERYAGDFRTICAIIGNTFDILDSPESKALYKDYNLVIDDKYLVDEYFQRAYVATTFDPAIKACVDNADFTQIVQMEDILFKNLGRNGMTPNKTRISERIFNAYMMPKVSGTIEMNSLTALIRTPDMMTKAANMLYRINSRDNSLFANNRVAALFYSFSEIFETASSSDSAMPAIQRLNPFTEQEQRILSNWALYYYDNVEKKPVFLLLGYAKYASPFENSAPRSMDDAFSQNMPSTFGGRVAPMGSLQSTSHAPLPKNLTVDFEAMVTKTGVGGSVKTFADFFENMLKISDCEGAIGQAGSTYITTHFITNDKKADKETEKILDSYELITRIRSGDDGGKKKGLFGRR